MFLAHDKDSNTSLARKRYEHM